MTKKISILLLMLLLAVSGSWAETPNEKQARSIFLEAFNLVFGDKGCSLRYNARLSFFFKSNGRAWLRKNKYAYDDTKTCGWCADRNFYYVDRRKKEVQILNGHSETNGSVMDKFKFNVNDYNYHIQDTKEGLLITVKAKPHTSGVRTAKVLVDRRTHYPKRLSVRVAVLWAKLDISDFRSGGLSDETFVFPREKFKGYKVVDKRKK
jgi:hypothetical protein